MNEWRCYGFAFCRSVIAGVEGRKGCPHKKCEAMLGVGSQPADMIGIVLLNETAQIPGCVFVRSKIAKADAVLVKDIVAARKNYLHTLGVKGDVGDAKPKIARHAAVYEQETEAWLIAPDQAELGEMIVSQQGKRLTSRFLVRAEVSNRQVLRNQLPILSGLANLGLLPVEWKPVRQVGLPRKGADLNQLAAWRQKL